MAAHLILNWLQSRLQPTHLVCLVPFCVENLSTSEFECGVDPTRVADALGFGTNSHGLGCGGSLVHDSSLLRLLNMKAV